MLVESCGGTSVTPLPLSPELRVDSAAWDGAALGAASAISIIKLCLDQFHLDCQAVQLST